MTDPSQRPSLLPLSKNEQARRTDKKYDHWCRTSDGHIALVPGATLSTCGGAYLYETYSRTPTPGHP